MLHRKKDSRSNRAFCPVSTAILCSSLEAQRCFPYSLNSLTLCHTSSSPCFQEEDYRGNCGSAPPHPPIYLLLFLHLTVWGDDNTPIYFTLTQPSCITSPHLLFLFLILSISPQPPCSLSLSGEMSAVLYFAVTLKAAFIRFILRRCGNGMVSLHYTYSTDTGRCVEGT